MWAKRPSKAVVSMITPNFFGIGGVFLASLFENAKLSRNTDVVLMHDDHHLHYSQSDIRYLKSRFPQVTLRKVDTGDFNRTNMRRYREDGTPNTRIEKILPNKRVAFLKPLFFTLGYKRVLWLDCDTLIIRRLSHLFHYPGAIYLTRYGARRKPGRYRIKQGAAKCNSGVMMFSGSAMGTHIYEDYMDELNKLVPAKLSDQAVIQRMFTDRRCVYLPNTYNFKLSNKRLGDLDSEVAKQHARIIHFVGPTKFWLNDDHPDKWIWRYYHEMRTAHGIAHTLSG